MQCWSEEVQFFHVDLALASPCSVCRDKSLTRCVQGRAETASCLWQRGWFETSHRKPRPDARSLSQLLVYLSRNGKAQGRLFEDDGLSWKFTEGSFFYTQFLCSCRQTSSGEFTCRLWSEALQLPGDGGRWLDGVGDAGANGNRTSELEIFCEAEHSRLKRPLEDTGSVCTHLASSVSFVAIWGLEFPPEEAVVVWKGKGETAVEFTCAYTPINVDSDPLLHAQRVFASQSRETPRTPAAIPRTQEGQVQSPGRNVKSAFAEEEVLLRTHLDAQTREDELRLWRQIQNSERHNEMSRLRVSLSLPPTVCAGDCQWELVLRWKSSINSNSRRQAPI